MSDDSVREQLSSLMDGELPPDSARFLSKRLGNDADLAATWERWHCARDILRQQGTLAPGDFCANVRAALDADDVVVAPVTVQGGGRVWRGLAGGAIAAGVAVFALMLGQPAVVPESAPARTDLTHTVIIGLREARRRRTCSLDFRSRHSSTRAARPRSGPP